MSKYKEGHDATEDVVNDIIARMDEFYASHPNKEDHFLLYFKLIIRKVIIAWKKRMIHRNPYNFNDELSKCTDISKRQIERFPLKD